jgi:DnaA family protein
VGEVSKPQPGDVDQVQLPLQIQLRDEATFDNFLPSPASAALLASLRQQAAGDGEAIVYIHGPAGAGKSHLLQAACQLAGSAAIYLPLADLARFRPEEVLQGIESLDLVCLDDVDSAAGKDHWEEALFHLCNRARQRGCRLLVAGKAAPRALSVTLEDLRSRLGWGIVYQLAAPADEEKIDILRFRAASRGLQLAPEVCVYLVSRAPRDLDSLLAVLDTLDSASLAHQRALSIPFIKGVMGW